MPLDPRAMLSLAALTLLVSGSAATLAALIGVPAGILLAIEEFPGRRAFIAAANALMFLPPVVVGLSLYLLLSFDGPAGIFRLVYTPTAMILAQFTLALPLVTALAHRAAAARWRLFRAELLLAGAGTIRRARAMLAMARRDIVAAALAGFGRAISETGAALVVGGNILGITRTMNTAMTLDAVAGHVRESLVLGGAMLTISLAIGAAVFALSSPNRGKRKI